MTRSARMLVLFLALCPPALAGAIVDQECDGGLDAAQDIFSTNYLAQTFTAGIDGSLTAVEARLYADAGVPVDAVLTVEVRGTAAGGAPGTGVLGTATIVASAIVDYEFATVYFPPGAVEVSAGSVYAIVFRTDLAWAPGATFGSNGSMPDDTYPGGTAWQSGDGVVWTQAPAGGGFFDRHFRTWVDPYVPRDPEAAMEQLLFHLDADIATGTGQPWLKSLLSAKKSAEQALALYRENPGDQPKVLKSLGKVVKSMLSAKGKGYPDVEDLIPEIGWTLGLNLATLAMLDAEGAGADAGLLGDAEEWIDSGSVALHGGEPLPAMADYAKSAKISVKARKKAG